MLPKDTSFSGRLKMGSSTVRTADSISSTRVLGGHPAGFDVQQGHAPVVAIEHGEEVFRQVMLIARVQGSHDAEVDRRVLWVTRVRCQHEKCCPDHVGMKEVMPEHLGEKNTHAVFAIPGNVERRRRAGVSGRRSASPWIAAP